MYIIIFSSRAEKQLNKLQKEYKIRIKNSINRLSQDPFAVDIKKLGAEYDATHRFRVGSYRLFLLINTTSKTIIIAEIKRRTTQTYR